jgi:hypothetical protein
VSAEARDAEEARCPIHDWCDGPRGHVGQCAAFEDGETFADGIKAALKIIDVWRARENAWLERARKGDIAPRTNAPAIADDARSREAVLRGAAADIRALLKGNS